MVPARVFPPGAGREAGEVSGLSVAEGRPQSGPQRAAPDVPCLPRGHTPSGLKSCWKSVHAARTRAHRRLPGCPSELESTARLRHPEGPLESRRPRAAGGGGATGLGQGKRKFAESRRQERWGAVSNSIS